MARRLLLRCYDGFEPSGRMHIAQGLVRALNVNKMVEAGCVFIFWVADLFAMLNGKLGGDLARIRTVGRYFIEVWRAAGMRMENVKFLWASEEINRRPNEYWLSVLKIACKHSVARIQRCATIMGRKEEDALRLAQLFYPCMQCADIFFLDVDVCQLGLDQKKVNMLAIEHCGTTREPPVIVSHAMISGLVEGMEKMSKSVPESAIFMEDTAKEVIYKIRKAYCPERKVEGNPILDYCHRIVFAARRELFVPRSPANGGDITFSSYSQLVEAFATGNLHPNDLKPAVATVLNELIEPVRKHFETDPQAKALLKTVKSFAAEAVKDDS